MEKIRYDLLIRAAYDSARDQAQHRRARIEILREEFRQGEVLRRVSAESADAVTLSIQATQRMIQSQERSIQAVVETNREAARSAKRAAKVDRTA